MLHPQHSPKVRHFHVVLLVQQQVLGFKVAAASMDDEERNPVVNTRVLETRRHVGRRRRVVLEQSGNAPVHHVVVVAVLDAGNDLLEEVARLRLGELHR